MPTAPAANPAKDVESAYSFTATARTVAASGFAINNAMTISHHRPAQDLVFSHGISISATGATAASTISAKERKIIEHIRINARTQTMSVAKTVTTMVPVT
ncbi:hypothetical protein [Arthrobacter sp. lap29]|uniref:hypothetical protein n=1 Tax=Arthrobacter sp. lap29 TaxID=3056122 RepID=UPI0028F73A8F|nr:hypothetical protein [Arthrobacter sp. lap29]